MTLKTFQCPNMSPAPNDVTQTDATSRRGAVRSAGKWIRLLTATGNRKHSPKMATARIINTPAILRIILKHPLIRLLVVLYIIILTNFQILMPAFADFYNLELEKSNNIKYRIIDIRKKKDIQIDVYRKKNGILAHHFDAVISTLRGSELKGQYDSIWITFYKIPLLVSPNPKFVRFAELAASLEASQHRAFTPWSTFKESEGSNGSKLEMNFYVSDIQTILDLHAIVADRARPGAQIFRNKMSVEFSKCFSPLLKRSGHIVLFGDKTGETNFKEVELKCVSRELAPSLSFFLLNTKIPRRYISSFHSRLKKYGIYIMPFYNEVYEQIMSKQKFEFEELGDWLEFARDFDSKYSVRKSKKLGKHLCDANNG